MQVIPLERPFSPSHLAYNGSKTEREGKNVHFTTRVAQGDLDLYARISAPCTVRSCSGDIHRIHILTSLRFLCIWKTLNTNTLSVLSKRYIRINKCCPTQCETSYKKLSKSPSYQRKTQVDSRKRISDFDIFALDCVLIQGLACRE